MIKKILFNQFTEWPLNKKRKRMLICFQFIRGFLFLIYLIQLNSFCTINATSSQLNDGHFNSTTIKPDYYIITFKNRFKWQTRKQYIERRVLDQLNKEDVFEIINRNQYYTQYPSDFDLIKLKSNNTQSILSHLKTHPAIKRFTVEKQFHNYLLNHHEANDNQTEFNCFNSRQIKFFNQNEFSMPLLNSRKLFRAISRQITSILHADYLWNLGITGAGIKVAIFDTGLPKNHPHFKKVKERTNWTNEKTLDDKLGHGTFVAGLIASSKECLGFAPDAELHIYRVFTSNQVSYTSWFLDAFNYAILKKINILNLSIGGPDFTGNCLLSFVSKFKKS